MLAPPLAVAGRRAVVIDLLLALVVGGLAYALSCWLVPMDTVVKGFGEDWLAMSVAPLELPGRLPHRLLAPFLAHGLGLGGAGYLTFVRGLNVLLLATVFFFCRRRSAPVFDAGLITAAIALTAPVQMYKLHWVGYPDPITYGVFLWMILAAARPAVFWALFFVSLTNHELAVFLLPWLWFLRRSADRNWWADAVGAGVALAAYAALYFWVKANAPQQHYNYEFFAKHPLFPGGTFVVVLLAMTHLVVAFGPVLSVLAWHQHQKGHGSERWHLWLVGAGVFVIFCIAFDWARHSNLVLVPLVLASLRFLAAGHRILYAGLIALGVGLMSWIPPWSPTAWPTGVLADLAFWIRSGVVVVSEHGYGAGPLSAALNNWLPESALMLLAIAGIGLAIWGFGALLARRERRRAA